MRLDTAQVIRFLRERGQRVSRNHVDEARAAGYLASFELEDVADWGRRGCPTSTRSLVWPECTDEEFEAYANLQESRLPADRLELARFCARQAGVARIARQECDRLRRENAKLRLALAKARAEE